VEKWSLKPLFHHKPHYKTKPHHKPHHNLKPYHKPHHSPKPQHKPHHKSHYNLNIKKPATPKNNTLKTLKSQDSSINVYYNERVQNKLKKLEQIEISLLKHEKDVLQTENKRDKEEKQF
jgi:hypothetical protein